MMRSRAMRRPVLLATAVCLASLAAVSTELAGCVGMCSEPIPF
jgi:hypothetical protein